ncbi:hypothetical protein Zmor_005679 [Zophobas morio]|uniref:Coilin N-terminal domain-containing protein n=1 Tax=Zophobas morio TaxID=2755281 RepID=A0AA38ITE8_9CUCU|nr:hypothetical protein Zmor_005679 [Zophobas morio]
MRITVNLSLFFHDHRCLAKIFVNKKMKCIRNVEERISAVFNIENFYLKCENVYLPPTEDVQILNYDDVVWVIPSVHGSSNVDVIPQNHEILEEFNIVIPKKKKKKNRLCVDTKEENENIPKKKKRQESSDNVMEVDVSVTEEKNNKKNKKKKKKHGVYKNVEVSNDSVQENEDLHEIDGNSGLMQKSSGRDSLDSSKSAKSPKSVNNSVNRLVNQFEKSKNSLTETPTELERKINIAKTIIISNKPTLCSFPDVKQTEACEEEKNDTCNNVSLHVENLNKNDELQADESSSSAETSSVCINNVTDFDANVNKRKRRRTRKRKSRVENTSEFSTTDEQPVHNFIHKPVIVQTRISTHLRFTDVQPSTKKDVLFPAESRVDKVITKEALGKVIVLSEPLAKQSVPASDAIGENTKEKVTIKDLLYEAVVLNESSEKKDKTKTIYSDKELEECILKQPITQHLEPRVGDVLAFKILRMSENYTPEVSKPIVPREDGHEQCLPPKGKFSLDEEEHELNENSHFQCLWPTLLEPRLVYP